MRYWYLGLIGYCTLGVWAQRPSALHKAAALGQVKRIEVLLAKGAKVDVVDRYGRTPLHEAAKVGTLAICRLLLEAGANPSIQQANGWAPLHEAAQTGSAEVCLELIEAGADAGVFNMSLITPLHLSAGFGYSKTTQVLLAAGAPVSPQDGRGNTPLHYAAAFGHKEVCDELIKAQAKIEVRNFEGQTPLHLAIQAHGVIREVIHRSGARSATEHRLLEIGEWTLHNRSAHMNESVFLNSKTITYSLNNSGIALALIAAGANLNAKDIRQKTPLNLTDDEKLINQLKNNAKP